LASNIYNSDFNSVSEKLALQTSSNSVSDINTKLTYFALIRWTASFNFILQQSQRVSNGEPN